MRRVHCDVKPQNMFVGEGGRAVLGDFDVSKKVQLRAASATIALRLTPEYAAPEELTGHTATQLSDVYALGLSVTCMHSALSDVYALGLSMTCMHSTSPSTTCSSLRTRWTEPLGRLSSRLVMDAPRSSSLKSTPSRRFRTCCGGC
jgi:serine/threonine protein kinase